jgi:hypothetical protein
VPTRPTPEQALARLYIQAAKTLRQQIREAHKRGATGTAAYRAAQLQRVQLQLRVLEQRTPALALQVAAAPYTVAATAVDVAFGEAGAAYAFTGSHLRAATVIAQNLANRLDDSVQLVGRRTEDAFRRIALEEVGQGVAAGTERRTVSAAIQQRLVNEGVTDAVTGFVTRDGRRLQLDDYARMVARTTTREAMSAGISNRMAERGEKLITISAHATSCDICQPYEGNTYALPGTEAEGYDTIDQLPPFHPNCLHVATPAAGSADRFLASLGLYGRGQHVHT